MKGGWWGGGREGGKKGRQIGGHICVLATTFHIWVHLHLQNLLLLCALFNDPVKTVLHAFLCQPRARLDLPLPVSQSMQVEPFGNSPSLFCLRDILLICVDKDGGGCQLWFIQQFHQLFASLLHTFFICRINHIDQHINLIKVVLPIRPNLALTCNVNPIIKSASFRSRFVRIIFTYKEEQTKMGKRKREKKRRRVQKKNMKLATNIPHSQLESCSSHSLNVKALDNYN